MHFLNINFCILVTGDWNYNAIIICCKRTAEMNSFLKRLEGITLQCSKILQDEPEDISASNHPFCLDCWVEITKGNSNNNLLSCTLSLTYCFAFLDGEESQTKTEGTVPVITFPPFLRRTLT